MKTAKKIKLIFFDVDGVLFDVSGYCREDEKVAVSTRNILFDELGIYDEHERLKNMFLSGKFRSYMEWTDHACKILQRNGLTRELFMKVIDKRPLMKGRKKLLEN